VNIFRFLGLMRLSPLGTSAAIWPVVPAPGDDDDEFGEIGEMSGRGNPSSLRKLASMPLCPPQIPHDLTLLEPSPPLWEDGH
jgi:hypothetical protein